MNKTLAIIINNDKELNTVRGFYADRRVRGFVREKYEFLKRNSGGEGVCVTELGNYCFIDYYRNNSNYEVISFQEFKERYLNEPSKEITSLPEKWCISRNISKEANEIVTNWINSKFKTTYMDSIFIDDWYGISETHTRGKLEDLLIHGYAEITFDQFKKWVLKENVSKGLIDNLTIGKWYEFKWNWNAGFTIIIKIKHIRSGYIGGEYINKTQSSTLSTGDFYIGEVEEIKELQLNEIQQYLPDGHIDKVAKKESMFKKGDYIVPLKVNASVGDSCSKENHCFKQRLDNEGIYPEVDTSGSRTNGHSIMSFDKKGFLLDWRYATQEEIDEYNRLGKPFDVTTLKSVKQEVKIDTYTPRKGKIGDKIKLTDKFDLWHSDGSHCFKTGDILIITKVGIGDKYRYANLSGKDNYGETYTMLDDYEYEIIEESSNILGSKENRYIDLETESFSGINYQTFTINIDKEDFHYGIIEDSYDDPLPLLLNTKKKNKKVTIKF